MKTNNPNSKYVYAIDTNPEHLEPDLEDGPEALLIIGTRKDWENRHCASDYENEETLALLSTLNMYPETEGTWFIEKGKTQTVINLLSSNPDYDNDDGFQKFIDECP